MRTLEPPSLSHFETAGQGISACNLKTLLWGNNREANLRAAPRISAVAVLRAVQFVPRILLQEDHCSPQLLVDLLAGAEQSRFGGLPTVSTTSCAAFTSSLL